MRALTITAFFLVLCGCGGTGDSDPAPLPPPVIAASSPAGMQGQAYQATLSVSGGTGFGYQWSLVQGALPTGLALLATGNDSATIGGIPTADGQFSFTVQVLDSISTTGTLAMQIDIAPAPPLSIDTVALPQGQQGQHYTGTVSASGGSGAGFMWRIASGTLPTGITLSTVGTPAASISGTSTATGTFMVVIEVEDSLGFVASKQFSVNLTPAPTLQVITTSLPTGLQGQAYSVSVSAGGGSGNAYQWSIAAGSLPAGMGLSPTGTPAATLNGTPAGPGTFNFMVHVQDSIGLQATQALQLVIDPAVPLSITTTTIPGASQSLAYNAPINAMGGSGTGYAWSVIAGSLPPGIVLASIGTPASSLSGTSATLGTFNFTVQVQDSVGLTATQALQITVAVSGPLTITSGPQAPDAIVNVAYQHVLTASGGTGPYQWAITQGVLPAPLALGAAGTPSTLIAGVPVAIGRLEFTVRVTDALSANAFLAMTLVVTTGMPADTWSTQISGPHDRGGAAVFTGTHIVQWGGHEVAGGFFGSSLTSQGDVINPQNGQSTPTSLVGAPSARLEHTAVWTGTRMLVYGGRDSQMNPLADLRAYDPVIDQWSLAAPAWTPPARYGHTAIWTGAEMLVWGGMGPAGTLSDGAAYDPATDQWRQLPAAPAGVISRYRHKAVWTGTRMIIWGGENQPAANPPSQILYDGAVYDFAANSWPASITPLQAPQVAAANSVVVWTGASLLVWGYHEGVSEQRGSTWNPATATWTPMATLNQPLGRFEPTGIWTGADLCTWGGLDAPGANSASNDGAIFDAAAGAWSPMSAVGAPFGRFRHYMFWTGREVIIWGGKDMGFAGSNPYASGAIYTP